jgi:hypothetical protein
VRGPQRVLSQPGNLWSLRYVFKTVTVILVAIVLAPIAVNALPSVSNLSAPDNAGLYEKFEATFDVATVATNYYWPYDASPAANVSPHPNAVPAGVGVSVDGFFLPPGESNWSNAVVQPGFYYQPFYQDANNPDRMAGGRTWMYPDGPPQWKIRFAPTRVGQWKFKIRITDSSGTFVGDERAFVCETSPNHGFVRVSPTDSRYFELSDGTYLPLIGLSVDAAKLTEFESQYAKLQSMGVNLVRSWWQSSIPGTALFGAGGQGGDGNWTNLVVSSEEVRPGRMVSGKLTDTSGGIKTVFSSPAVKPSTAYILSVWVKTVGLVGSGDYGFEIIVAPVQSQSLMTKVVGSTDWHQVFYTFTTTPTQYEVQWANIRVVGVTGGAAYFTDASLRENLGGGNYGPELLIRTDFQPHAGYPQQIAWTIDKQLETAEKYGIYAKAVIEEKSDSFFSRIQPDGTYGPNSDDNVYATASHACRTYQSYYWRYLIARYGYNTALHSVEYVNEGDPGSAIHQNAVEALGEYFRAHDPNRHLVSTSNWHSFPPPMWNRTAIDCADLHMYMGWGVAMGGNRLWPGWDGNWSIPNTLTALGTGWEIDNNTKYEGLASLKVTTLPGDATRDSNLSFMVGVVPGHSYKISWMAKANGILAPDADHKYTHQNPGVSVYYAELGGDWVGVPTGPYWVLSGVGGTGGTWGIPNGTYDWQLVETPPFTVTAANANLMCVMLQDRGGNGGTTEGVAWFDDLVVTDVTTGKVLNYNGGFEYMDSESYDVVAGHSSYSQLIRSFGFNKPTIRGETGFTHPQRFTDPYKGFAFSGEDQLLLDDSNGIWWKKWVWANMDPGGLVEIYWWKKLLLDPNFGGKYPKYGKAYQDFMAGIPLSNGHYQDVAATVSNPGMRVLGQKDLTNNRAHLWIDNPKHTWKNVVDGVTIPPVSGTVKVSGLRNGPYKVEWWDTSSGAKQTETKSCTGGQITLTVDNLTTDKACKIYPDDSTPLVGSVSINLDAEYTNSSTATLSLWASDESGVTDMRFSNDGSSWSEWEAYNTGKNWNLLPGDGAKTVYVQYKDGADEISTTYNDSIILDSLQPCGTIIINSGVACTGSAGVMLTLAATDVTSGVTYMRFSNDAASWSAWQPFEQTKAWTTTVGDGTKTVYVQFMDGATNISQNCSDTIALQPSGPTGSIVINAGSTYTNSISATLTLSATDDACGVLGMRFSNNGSAWSVWEEYRTSKAWTLTAGDGAKTVYVQYKDCAETLSNICTGNITVDTTPPACSIVINGGDAQTNTASVTLTLSATDAGSGVSRMRFSNDDSTWTTWESYADSKSWTLVSGDGTKTVYVQYDDVAGNVSASYSDLIELMATVPTGSVTINDGDAYTSSTSVTLTLSDGGGAAVQMRFSNDGSAWTAWEEYGTSKAWTLTAGDGAKTVYVQYRDSAGLPSNICTGNITVDTGQPTGSININTGAQYANSANVTVIASVSDTGSGLAQMRWSNDGSTWSAWESYAASKSWALTSGNGTRTVYAQFKDEAGNTSSSLSDTITLDTMQPTGSVSINSGAAYATSTSITLSLSASDSGSGVAQMRFSNDGTAWSSWESYGTGKSWTLTAGDGTKTVYAQYKDGAGNTSQNCTDTIVLTTSGPTGTITINDGAQYAKTKTVTLALSASGGPNRVTQMRFANDDGTKWSAWESFAASKSWSLSSGDGSKTVYAEFKDEAGRASPSCSDTIIVKTAAPTLSITSPTSDSDYATNHPSLAISGTASSDVVSLVWATNSGDTGECTGTTAWETDEIALTEGANTVTITAMDGAGSTAAVSLTLDRVDVHPPDTWEGTMMVSIPIIPDEPDPKAAVGFDGNGWCIFRPTQNNYVVYENDPEQLTWFVPAASTPGRGFWAWFSDTVRTPLGSIPRQDQPATIHLYPGWNIIGNPFVSPVQWDVKQIGVRGVGGSQKTLQNSRNVVDDFAYGWRHSGGVGTYYIVYDSRLWPGVDDALTPWMAYWIRAYRECDLVIPAPPYDP